MEHRRSQIYIRPQTKRLLYLIARARNITADEAGDTILQETILKQYPAMKGFLQEVEEIEQRVVAAIQQDQFTEEANETT